MSTDDRKNTSGAPEDGGTKPFWLDFKFDDGEDARSALDADLPKPKGEVYFANQTRAFRPAPAAPLPPGDKGKDGRKRAPREKRGTSGPVAALLVGVLLVTAALSFVGIATLRDILALGKNPEKAAIESLSLPGDRVWNTRQLVDLLADRKLIKQRAMCQLYMEFTEYLKTSHGDSEPPEYVPGEYEVDTAMGLEDMLGIFLSKPKSSETVSLLFPEGYTVRQVLEKIGNNKVSNVSLLKRSMLATQFEYEFFKGLDTEGRYYKYEGYLFPDTYEFYIDENANSALRRFFDNFRDRWKEEYTTRAVELGYSIDQIVTLASIIQKEANGPGQMKDISGVLHNRLDHQSVYPLLECDSTRDYVLNNIATEMDAGAAALYNDSYNTYKCTGLPVGPICNPGIVAIEAALNPKKHDYFYFQHDKNGDVYYSKTKEEHYAITIQLVREGLAQ